MNTQGMVLKFLNRAVFVCSATLITSFAAHAAPVVTITAYGLDLNRPYGYQRVGATDGAEVSYASQPFFVPLGEPAGIYANETYPAAFEGYGYANGSSGVLKASASTTSYFIENSAVFGSSVPWRYVQTWATASGVITISEGSAQTGTLTVRQEYDGAVRLTGNSRGGAWVPGHYQAWISYRKVGETNWQTIQKGLFFTPSPDDYTDFSAYSSLIDYNEAVFNVMAGERYEIYEGFMAEADVMYGITTEVDFSHTSILSITPSSGVVVNGQDGFLSGLLSQPSNDVPEPPFLALLLAGLSASRFVWRKKST